MFPVSKHSAEKVQNDINTILFALAQFLSKVNLDYKSQPVLPPIVMEAVLESEPISGKIIDVEVIPELTALSGHHPDLLEGRDNLAIGGNPTPPLLQSQTEVRLQIGDTYIIALLPDLRLHLEQLPAEKVAALTGAIGGSAETPTEVIDGEIIDVTINGTSCFHQEPGQATVNILLPAKDLQQIEPVDSAEAERIQDITRVTEIGEKGSEAPTVELRPAHGVEALTGQDNSYYARNIPKEPYLLSRLVLPSREGIVVNMLYSTVVVSHASLSRCLHFLRPQG